jgi:hypothetical protein
MCSVQPLKLGCRRYRKPFMDWSRRSSFNITKERGMVNFTVAVLGVLAKHFFPSFASLQSTASTSAPRPSMAEKQKKPKTNSRKAMQPKKFTSCAGRLDYFRGFGIPLEVGCCNLDVSVTLRSPVGHPQFTLCVAKLYPITAYCSLFQPIAAYCSQRTFVRKISSVSSLKLF